MPGGPVRRSHARRAALRTADPKPQRHLTPFGAGPFSPGAWALAFSRLTPFGWQVGSAVPGEQVAVPAGEQLDLAGCPRGSFGDRADLHSGAGSSRAPGKAPPRRPSLPSHADGWVRAPRWASRALRGIRGDLPALPSRGVGNATPAGRSLRAIHGKRTQVSPHLALRHKGCARMESLAKRDAFVNDPLNLLAIDVPGARERALMPKHRGPFWLRVRQSEVANRPWPAQFWVESTGCRSRGRWTRRWSAARRRSSSGHRELQTGAEGTSEHQSDGRGRWDVAKAASSKHQPLPPSDHHR